MRPVSRFVTAAVMAVIAATSLYAATDIQFSADQLSSSLAKGKEHTILSGHADVKTRNTRIQADRIELYGDNFRYAICSGNVDVVDSERKLHISGDQFFYDRETELARMEGNAVLEDLKNEVVVKAGFIESRGKEDLVLIQIGVRIFQKDVVARAELALYHRNTNTLDLSGVPVAYYKGDEYRAGRISIDLDTDDITLEGQVSGQIVTQEQKQNVEQSAAGNTAPPG
ncbi:MAG TPA: LptA/OstA family protein, partial [Spirochaetia bacterium]|nr:LptA/OstA family protein [Spirochaetia bacterium]